MINEIAEHKINTVKIIISQGVMNNKNKIKECQCFNLHLIS